MIRAIFLLLSLTLIVAPTRADDAKPSDFGKFSGNPKGQWLPDGVMFELSDDFYFIDDKNFTWFVPAPYRTDGASIPGFLKSFVGGNFDGPYRNAAIIHDYFCDHRTIDWEDVHLVFYKGMRTGGVGPRKAWVMYQAVYQFGPRWAKKADKAKECKAGAEFDPDKCALNDVPKESYTPPLNKDTFNSFLGDLRKQGYAEEAAQLERETPVQ
jgi:hypothetical protein